MQPVETKTGTGAGYSEQRRRDEPAKQVAAGDFWKNR